MKIGYRLDYDDKKIEGLTKDRVASMFCMQNDIQIIDGMAMIPVSLNADGVIFIGKSSRLYISFFMRLKEGYVARDKGMWV